MASIGPGCQTDPSVSAVQQPSVHIHEVMASNQTTLTDEDGDYSDWIELYNPSDSVVALHGFGLSDDHRDPYAWVLPDVSLAAGESLVIFASGKERMDPAGRLHTSFRLKPGGDEVVLTDRSGVVTDQVEIPKLPPDISLGRHPHTADLWQVFHRPTPGQLNGEDGWLNPFDGTLGGPNSEVRITEVLTRNRTSLLDEDGDSSDWIELHNSSDQALDLTAFSLSDDMSRPHKWRLPRLVLDPGEYIIVFASGKDRRVRDSELHTSFELSEDETLLLANPMGRVVDLVQLGTAFADRSTGRASADSGSWLYFPEPTPGGPNLTEGFEDLSQAPWRGAETLRITEALANNRQTLRDEFRQYSDWIEIHNITEKAIELEGVGLSDDTGNPYRWTFPQTKLGADQRLIVFLSGTDCAEARCQKLHAPFKLSNLGETLQLTSADGRILDRFDPGRTTVDVSSGVLPEEPRVRVFFTKPTPGRPNHGPSFHGYVRSPDIRFLPSGTPDTQQVTIESATTGSVIRYTLDGSAPHIRSKRYTEPFTVSTSQPIRARAWRDDLLPSVIETRTVLFEASQHTLPIVALSVDPAAMFDPDTGIHSLGPNADEVSPYKGANYWKAWEVPIHLELYEAEQKLGLEMDLGLRIFGAYSRAMPKKSFRIISREEYGDNTIDYPLLVDKAYTQFESFVLRTSGQDAGSTRFRDVFLTQLIRESGVDYQGYRTVVLYINGQYWGIYNIREKINPEMMVRAHGGDADQISILRANGFADHGSARDYLKLIDYVERHDLSKDEHYLHVQSLMDVENFAQYWIFQMFISNADNGNIRFWKEETSEGRWRWLLYDLDWAWRYVEPDTVAFATNPKGTGANKAFRTVLLRSLLSNDDFRDMFLRLCGKHLRETFAPDRTLALIDTLTKEIESEIPRDHSRWPDSFRDWNHQVEMMRTFATARPDRFRAHLQRYFQLSEADMIRYRIDTP
jgi:hypothetical protein